MALATFNQIKNFLELKKSTLDDYPHLSVMLPLLQGTFEKYCSRLFDLKERSKTFHISDVDGQLSFWLEGTPIVSISSITVDGEPFDDYQIFEQNIELLSTAPKGSTVIITYTGGLIDQNDDDSIPLDLNLATIQQVSYMYQNRSKLGATDISIDTNSTKLPGLVLLPIVTDVLDRYRNFGTGF